MMEGGGIWFERLAEKRISSDSAALNLPPHYKIVRKSAMSVKLTLEIWR